MKRCGVCIGILAGLILLCLGSLLIIRWQCRQFSYHAQTIAEFVEAHDTEEAMERFNALNAEWESFHNICGLFVNGEKLDPIRELLSELPPLIESGHPETVSSLEKLRGLIDSVYEEEFPAIWHIL